MKKLKINLFLTVILSNALVIIASPPQCCDEGVYLRKGGCTNNMTLNIPCKSKYLLNPNHDHEASFTINNDDTLQSGDSAVEVDQYCLGKFSESENTSAIICAQEGRQTQVPIIIATTISILFLTLTIIVYGLLPKLRDLQGKCILNSLIGLDVAFLVLTVLQFQYDLMEHSCFILAFLMYYSFLIAFFWLNLISFNMWRTTIFNDAETNPQRTFLYYCMYGYGCPTLFLIVTLITHHAEGDHIKPGFGAHSCWFSGFKEIWLYFYGPIMLLIIINTVFFVWTSIKLQVDIRQYNEQKLKTLQYRFFLYLKLFFIMGLTWIFELLSHIWMDVHPVLNVIWLITDFLNAIQGVLLFMILVLFRRRVLRSLAEKEIFACKLPKAWKTMQDVEEESNEADETEFELRSRENENRKD